MNKTALIIVVALAVGLGAGYLLFGGETARDIPGETSAGTAADAPLYYRNPMNPAITSPVPAKDHMGMDYIPVYADGGRAGNAPVGTVEIDPVVRHNIGLRTALAEKHGVDANCITIGNGSNDVLDMIARVFLYRGRESLFSEHAFAVYPISSRRGGPSVK